MNEIVDIIVGFDQRESVAYHTFTQSVIENSTIPVRFLPLSMSSLSNYKEVHKDGSKNVIALNHTYNQAQIDWYNEGSALNLIKKENAA